MSTGPSYQQTGNNLRHLPSRPSSLFANGGGGGDNDDMEARVTTLEEAVKNLSTKADLDGLRQATKADLDGLRQATKADLDGLRQAAKADLDGLRQAAKTEFAELRTSFAELRADMAKSQSDMHKAIADNHRWTHGALIGIATVGVIGIIGVIGAIWNAGKPAAPSVAPSISAPAPSIIINVPPSVAPQQEPAPAPAQ